MYWGVDSKPSARWSLHAGVPPLPPITSVKGLGPAYKGYTWMYDQNFVIRSYSFSNLDMVRRCFPLLPKAYELIWCLL